MAGQTTVVKQCMPDNEVVVVERLTGDDLNEILNPGSRSPDTNARFYPGKVTTKTTFVFCKLHFENRKGIGGNYIKITEITMSYSKVRRKEQ